MNPSINFLSNESNESSWDQSTNQCFRPVCPCCSPLFLKVSMQRINHRLRRFVGMSKLKKVALNVIAQQLTEAEIGHLRGVSCFLLL